MSFSTTSTNAILGLPLHIFIYSFNLTQLTFPHWCSNLSLLCTRPNHLKQLSFHLSSIGVILIFKWIFSSWILCASLDTRLCFAFLFFFFTRFGKTRLLFMYCSMNSNRKCWLFCSKQCIMYCSGTHKFHFLATFSLKMGPTVLFTHLKIILLQWFQQ